MSIKVLSVLVVSLLSAVIVLLLLVLDGFIELIRVRGNVRDGFINADKVLVWFGITPH